MSLWPLLLLHFQVILKHARSFLKKYSINCSLQYFYQNKSATKYADFHYNYCILSSIIAQAVLSTTLVLILSKKVDSPIMSQMDRYCICVVKKMPTVSENYSLHGMTIDGRFWQTQSIYGRQFLRWDPHMSNLDRTRCLAGCEESFVP
jgi:hypothetical protein